MLLDLRHKLLFVHIAKTGGTSVRAALKPYQRRHPLFTLQFLASRMSHLCGHRIGCKFPRHAKLVAAQEMLPRELFEALFKFGFVRNPWDLQVSSFHHVRKERPEAIAHVEDFAAFLRFKFRTERPFIFHLDICAEPQIHYLKGTNGRLAVDFVGRYENLQADFDTICDRGGLPRQTLPHKRKAESRERYRRYYSEEDAALVAEVFAEDIAEFGYEF